MFQDIRPQSGGDRRRRLHVPDRSVSYGAAPLGARGSVYVERVTISDVVVVRQTTQRTEAVVSAQHEEMFSPVHTSRSDPEEEIETVLPVDTSEKIVVDSRKQNKKHRKVLKFALNWPKVKCAMRWSGIALLVALTAWISIDTYLTNLELKRRLEALPGAATSESATPGQRQAAEGTDETKPSGDAIEKYAVAADMPRVIRIEKISVKARVLQMGINPDGSMQAPVGIYDAGWYSGSSRPGTRGAAVIDAHASGPTRQGLFAYLDKLETGDTVEIERGDRSKLVYKVIGKETVAKDSVDMQKLMSAQGSSDEALNLITCNGTWVGDQRTFSHRTIIYTEKI